MTSPVPKHLRGSREVSRIPKRLREHRCNLKVTPVSSLSVPQHPAKYAPGLATALVDLAACDPERIGDPMAGTGRIASETGLKISLNEPDPRWSILLRELKKTGCVVSFCDARRLPWTADTLIFSPPYYPRTDRRVLAAHNDIKRGKSVGYRSGYGAEGVSGFIGDPAGAHGILSYRNAMREVYVALLRRARRMFVVVKNTKRLGVELRLDLDTIITAQEAGWMCVCRHGWEPPPSLWQRYNNKRGTAVLVEDVLVFEVRS
jgi:hypothetical protein